MKMFNLLNIGERAGSGVPNIFMVWHKENLGIPQYKETMNASRIKLTLPIQYTSDKKQLIYGIFETDKKYKTSEIAGILGMSPARTRMYLKELVNVGELKSEGINKSKVYFLPNKV